jgi:serine/threonine protein kinase
MDPELARDLRSTHMRLLSSKRDLEMLRADIAGILEEHACTKHIGGDAYRYCSDSECSRCILVKLDVMPQEIKLLKRITERTSGHRFFKEAVLQYKDDLPYVPKTTFGPETRILVTNYVKGPTLQAISNRLSRKDLTATLLLVFLTLDYLHRSESILHMDLKGENIVMKPWPFDTGLRLRVTGHGIFVVPKMTYFPVVVDFGNATNGKIFGTTVYDKGQWKGRCYFPGFDIFRLLGSLPTSFDVLELMGFSDVDLDSTYSMLAAPECDRLMSLFPTYASVVDFLPFSKFRQP